MSDFTVRTALASDIDAFVESVAALFREDGGAHDPYMDTGWPEREGAAYYTGLLDDPECLLLVATDGRRIVGHLVGKLLAPDSIRLARFAVLESLRVRPDVRGQGVADLLVERFSGWAREHGATRASVTAYAGNQRAQRLYARHGFSPTSVTMRAPL